MRCFRIDLNEILRISLLGKETLIPPRMHCSRYLTEYVMYFIIKGELNMDVNHTAVKLVPGDIYLFREGDRQVPLESSFCEYYYIHFKSDKICEAELSEDEYSQLINKKREQCLRINSFSDRCYDFLNVVIKQMTHIRQGKLFEDIKELLKNSVLTTEHKYPQKRLEISNSIASVLIKLESSDVRDSDKKRADTQRCYDMAKRVASYIEQNYNRNITGKLIENKFYLTYDYLNGAFCRVMGCTINKYCNVVRIQHAKAMLIATNMTITEVAIETGFDNIHYFSRLFKKKEGVTPTEFRRRFLKIADKE